MTTTLVDCRNINELPPKTNEFRRFLRIFFGRKVVAGSALILLLLILSAFFAPQLAPHDPYQNDLNAILQGPSTKHLLGTDPLGRDVLSRIVYGSRVSLGVGIIAVGLGAFLGMALGLLAGYFGGFISTFIMRCIDALMAAPPMMLALALAAALGGGIWNVMISLGVSFIPVQARLMRGQVLSVRSSDFITAGKVLGANNLRIMIRHIFPNCLPPLIVLTSINLGTAILSEASLSFLGIGIKPPGAAWGSMVSEGSQFLLNNPLLSFAPGLCVVLVVLALNIVGDGLRDALDPRLRGSI